MFKFALRQAELIERIYWFIKLRWLAALGVMVAGWFTSTVLRILSDPFPIYLAAMAIAFYNGLFLLFAKKIDTSAPDSLSIKRGNRFANIQISVDLLALTTLIHFAGGIENPLIFYFIFHMIIASILLSTRASYLQATLAIFLLSTLAGLERFHIIAHIPLTGLVSPTLYRESKYVLGILFAFTSTLYLAVYMATSITKKLRQRENELMVAEASLEARTKELEAANKRLQELDKLKSEYVLKVTHELRSPLSTIRSCLKVVTDGYISEVNEKQKNMLQRAEQRTNALLALVNDLLDLSRIKAGRVNHQMEGIALYPIIKKTTDFMRPQALDKKISLRMQVPTDLPLIKANKESMEQLLTNLLSNAIKYTTTGGKVTVSATAENDSVWVQVTDTGIGISEKDLPKIFDEFYRGNNAKAYDKEGTGLGLAIAKQIVTRHKGKIWVETQVGRGSRFNITLPKMKQP